MGVVALRPAAQNMRPECPEHMSDVLLPVTCRSSIHLKRLEHHHGGLIRPARSVGSKVLVDFAPARPQPVTLGTRGSTRTHPSQTVLRLGSRVRIGLQIEPPRRVSRTPAVHRHRDEVLTVLEIADQDLARLPRPPTGRGELKHPPAVRLGSPQPPPTAGHLHQPAMRVPEHHDEPARRQPGPRPPRHSGPAAAVVTHAAMMHCPWLRGDVRRATQAPAGGLRSVVLALSQAARAATAWRRL